MELLTADEQRNRRIYRWVLILALALILAIGFWLAKPPAKVNMKFLSVLNPRVNPDDSQSTSYKVSFSQTPAEVEKLVDEHLNARTHWDKRKVSSGPTGVAYYTTNGFSSPNISLMPEGNNGAVLLIQDPKSLVILPK